MSNLKSKPKKNENKNEDEKKKGLLESIKQNWLALTLIIGIIASGITGFLKAKDFIFQTVNDGIKLGKIKGIEEKEKTHSELPIGVIIAYGGENIPEGWLPCDGRTIPNDPKYDQIKEVLGMRFGDGNSFKLPDLRGRVPVGQGHGIDLSPRILGTSFGKEMYLLTESQLPSHTHSGTTSSPNQNVTEYDGTHIHERDGGQGDRKDCYVGAGDGRHSSGDHSNPAYGAFKLLPAGKHQHIFNHTHNLTIEKTGQNELHPTIQPSLVVNFIIKVTN